jgi:AraC family transcriptional regulator
MHDINPMIARLQWRHAKIAHCLLPAWEAEEIESVSEPGSVGVPFTTQHHAVVRRAGTARAEERHVPAASVGLCGPEALHWIRTPAPSDTVEITASVSLRREIAEAMGVAAHADLDDLMAEQDEVVLAIALRFRAACRGWIHLSDIERDEMVRCLYAHVYRRHFGGKWPAGFGTALSAQRLRRLTDFVMAHLCADLSIGQLATACAMSPFHFCHAFKAATGLAPHRFVTILRIRHAEERLRARVTSVESVAHSLGYQNLSHFRRAFRAQVGCAPGALAASAPPR